MLKCFAVIYSSDGHQLIQSKPTESLEQLGTFLRTPRTFTSVTMLEAPPDASKSVPLTHSVVVLIPYFSIISKSQSTGVNIKQLSNPPSSFTGMVRFFCLSSVRLGPRSTIQSVLQLCGKLMPTNTWPITSKARNMLGMHNATTKRF